jgi:hypothetical protein
VGISQVRQRPAQEIFLDRVKEISVLEGLLGILMDDPGRMIDLVSLGNDLKISRQTLSLYLSYLEESFLIRKLYNFGGNRRKVEAGGLEAFMRKFKVGEAVIISRDKDFIHEANGRKIRVVPAFKHFLSADFGQKMGGSS